MNTIYLQEKKNKMKTTNNKKNKIKRGECVKNKTKADVKHGEGIMNKIIDYMPFEAHAPGYEFCGPGDYRI